jgi:hypothetical protein
MRRFGTRCALTCRLAVLACGLVLSLGMLMALPATASGATSATASPEAASTISAYAPVPEAIARLSQAGILRGRDASSLVLQGYVTRGELAVYLARALGLADSTTPVFTDVVDSKSCFGAVGALYDAGVLAGATSATFSPDELVTREQAAVWIVESLGYKLSHDTEAAIPFRLSYYESADAWLVGFRDRSLVSDMLMRGVANGYRLGIVEATADGWLLPTLPLSRGDMAMMLARAFIQPISAKDAYPASLPARDGYPQLEPESQGPLVWYLEYRLTALKYCPGPIDGVYDYRTQDAVMAFQKVEMLKRDGMVGDTFWQRFPAAKTPVPELTEEGTRVEVDITRQVLFMITDNRVWKIVHVSTGSVRNATLTGHFQIAAEMKRPRWVMGDLGIWIYYPSYFDVEHLLAIHGSPKVPPWPASHGCVEVPMWMAIELFYQLPVGTQLYIYRS